jgi:predicted NAD/FAD-binding protein
MQRLAIIGTGIAGMSAAYFLKDQYDISVFEKNDYIGGHTNTVTVDHNGETASFDTGFMVFNFQTYPLLVKLFKKLDVPIKKTDMSFSVQNKETGLEYTGSGINGLFAQRKNLFKPSHYKFLLEIDRFNKMANEIATLEDYDNISIADFIKKYDFKHRMLEDYLIPMSSAVWSTPPEKMLDFSMYSLIRFFKNHGFLGLDTQYQWWTVEGGSFSYRDKLISSFEHKIQTGQKVKTISRNNGKCLITFESGLTEQFDKVIIAAHSDQAYNMLEQPTSLETEILPNFKYQKNLATIHTDTAVMPKNRLCWSSWNFCYNPNKEGKLLPSTIYYMNMLQGVSDKNDYFVSINGAKDVNPDNIIRQIEYHHPIFDTTTFRLQNRFAELNQEGPIHFVGAYQANGFHEDGIRSAFELCRILLGRDPL